MFHMGMHHLVAVLQQGTILHLDTSIQKPNIIVNRQNNVDNLGGERRDSDMETGVTSKSTFQKLRQRSLVGEVRDALEAMILDGDLRAGERLHETALADQLGVSRGPVREAARSLEREGLVRTVANQGVYVRELSIADVLELYDLRATLAGYLCARFAETGTQDDISTLETFVARMHKAAEADDEQVYFTLNLAFHDHISAASGATRAAAIYGALGKEVRLMRLRVLTGQVALQVSNKEHENIVRAIADRDLEAARMAGADHHLNGKKRLLEALEEVH